MLYTNIWRRDRFIHSGHTTSGKSWLLHIIIGETRRDIGLGSYPDISLSDARTKAREHQDLIKSGINPIQRAVETKQTQIITRRAYKTFSEVTKECHVHV